MTIHTNQQSQKFLVIDGQNLIIENPEIIDLYTSTDQWPGEALPIGRKSVEPCVVARKCLGVDDGEEACKQQCRKAHMSDNLYVRLMPYKNLQKLSKEN